MASAPDPIDKNAPFKDDTAALRRYHNAVTAVDIITSWDLIRTRAGASILTIPPGSRPLSILSALDGTWVLTENGILHLAESEKIALLLADAKSVLISECDESPFRETVVPAAFTKQRFLVEKKNGRRAA